MDQPERTTFSAYVGIDSAVTKHDACIQSGIEGKREFAVIPHQPSDTDEWVQSLLRRFTAPIAIAVKLSKGPIVYALQQYNGLVIFPVNPSTLAKYREAFKPSRAKDNPTDAELTTFFHEQNVRCEHVPDQRLTAIKSTRRALEGADPP